MSLRLFTTHQATHSKMPKYRAIASQSSGVSVEPELGLVVTGFAAASKEIIVFIWSPVWTRRYFVEKRYTVVVSYFCPGFRVVEGKPDLFGESG